MKTTLGEIFPVFVVTVLNLWGYATSVLIADFEFCIRFVSYESGECKS